MRQMEFKMERQGLLEEGQEVNVTESAKKRLPVSIQKPLFLRFLLFFYCSQCNTGYEVFLQERIYNQHRNKGDKYLCCLQ